ncbi:WD40 repeat domain-containing protein [Phanerochaete sordida]|uniref:WD40 repeat domain-containing protein n=1 Tax=Phanerochaete sordida TaxID=48140 RepID=A0A9P3LH41_9APHY|nr:WD40 repeat domain-containing protein [Phanerochaete sordida]
MFTLIRALDSEAAYHIYPSCLSGRGYGYPLWHPEPHQTGEPQIGDVGYLREGKFVRLFNINISAISYQVKEWSPRFKIEEALSLDVFRVAKSHATLIAGQLKSRGVERIQLHGEITGGIPSVASAGLGGGYSCREVYGAVLDLKSHADAETLYDNSTLEDYIRHEHHKWHAYATEEVKHRVRPEDIVLVSGWIKAPADWATVAFSNTSSTQSLSIKGQIGQFLGLSLSGTRRMAYSGPRMERKGAKYPKVADKNAPRNQCLFIKRYKIKKRLGIVQYLQAGAGYDSPPSRGGDESQSSAVLAADAGVEESGTLFCEGKNAMLEPVDILLDYILEVSNAQYAIARDEDIEGMLGGDIYPTDFSTYLRAKQPPVFVNDGFGRASVLELLLRTQARLEHPRITSPDLARWPAITAEGRANVGFGRIQLPIRVKDKYREIPKYAFLELSEATTTARSPHCYTLPSDGALVAAAWSTHITIWRTSDGLRLHRFSNDAAAGRVTAIAFSADGRRLASESGSAAVVIWDAIHGAALRHLTGHTKPARHIAFSPDGSILLSGDSDGTAIFWDARSGGTLATFALGTALRGVRFDSSGAHAAVTLANRVVLFALTPQIAQRAAIPLKAASDATVEFAPDGTRVLVCAPGTFARVYSTAKGKELLRLDARGRCAHAAAFADGGAAVVSVTAPKDDTQDVRVVRQDAARGTELFAVEDLPGTAAIAVSPDGALVVTPRDQGGIMVRNARSGQWIATVKGVARQVVTKLEFFPDSRRVLFAGATGPIGIVDVADTLRIL